MKNRWSCHIQYKKRNRLINRFYCIKKSVFLQILVNTWSGWWESNSRSQLGRLKFYHWTTPAKNGVPERNRTSDPLIKSQLLYRLSYRDIYAVFLGATENGWGTWIRTREMLESKSSALPLGYAPKNGGEGQIRTAEPLGTELQSAAFSHFATSPFNGADYRTWTHNLLITSQLLYQLS